MRPPESRAARSTPDKPWIETLVTVLEFIASERPELLQPLLSVAEDSPARFMLLRLTEEWETEANDLLRVALSTARMLDRLEARDSPRLTEDYLARLPYVTALHQFALQRRQRVTDHRRRRRLQHVRKRLEVGLEIARQRRRIQEFIGPPAKKGQGASDPRWVEDFIRG